MASTIRINHKLAAPPPIAKRVRNAKPKMGGPVKLTEISRFLYGWRGEIDAPNANLTIILDVTVELPMLGPKGTIPSVELAKDRKVFINLLAVSKGEAQFVLKYHVHGDHGAGKCHVHEAATVGKVAEKITLKWNGVSAVMSTGALFDEAKKAMDLTAQYQLHMTTGTRK